MIVRSLFVQAIVETMEDADVTLSMSPHFYISSITREIGYCLLTQKMIL